MLSGQISNCAPDWTSRAADSSSISTQSIPAVIVYEALIAAKREPVQGDLRMFMWTEKCRAFQADRAVTERGAFGANCDNADVLHSSARAGHMQ